MPKWHNLILGNSIEIQKAIEITYGPRMAKIAICESNLDQKAYNPKDPHGGSYGLFQVNGANVPQAKAMGLDVIDSISDNFEFAGIILKEQGYKAWGCNKRV